MPTPTHTLIEAVTLSSSASSVTFSSIPTDGTYRDLIVVCEAKADGGTFQMNLNGDTGGNYYYVYMNGNGSTTTSGASNGNSRIILNASGMSLSYSTLSVANIFDFSQTDKQKSVLVRGNNASSNTSAYAARWANTAAVTSVTIQNTFTPMTTGSTFSLYGIAG